MTPQEITEYAVWYSRKVRGPAARVAAALLEEFPYLREPLERAVAATPPAPLDLDASSPADEARSGPVDPWEAAEEAMPPGWRLEGLQLVDTSDSDDLKDEQLEWEAEASSEFGMRSISALGPTPSDALRRLTVLMRRPLPKGEKDRERAERLRNDLRARGEWR